MAHPDTYLNKVVVGSSSGQLQLLNFASGKKLFTFDIAKCRICCITPSPALDVIGLGMSDGYVLSLHLHIRFIGDQIKRLSFLTADTKLSALICLEAAECFLFEVLNRGILEGFCTRIDALTLLLLTIL